MLCCRSVYCLCRYWKWLEVKSIETKSKPLKELWLFENQCLWFLIRLSRPDQTPYLGWTWIIIKVLSINMAAGDLLVPSQRRISLFVPLFSFEVPQRAAWMWESWTSLGLKTSRRTHLNNCASTSQTSRSSFISTSTYSPWNRWVFHTGGRLLIICANAPQ